MTTTESLNTGRQIDEAAHSAVRRRKFAASVALTVLALVFFVCAYFFGKSPQTRITTMADGKIFSLSAEDTISLLGDVMPNYQQAKNELQQKKFVRGAFIVLGVFSLVGAIALRRSQRPSNTVD